MDTSVQEQSLLDDGLVKGQLRKVLALQGRQIGTENADLLVVELLHDVSRVTLLPAACGKDQWQQVVRHGYFFELSVSMISLSRGTCGRVSFALCNLTSTYHCN